MDSEGESQDYARVGTTLNGKWTLERLLGVGGMGAVYAGRHRNGAVAAIKVLHPSLARNKVLRERFLREGYAANKVGHAGVVKVQDDDVVSSGPDEGTAYLVMELLDGQSLQDRMDKGPPIDEREFLEIADSVLDVLQAAHKNGVVHRDLKPENLFLARQESGKPRVKVLDFGLARLLEEQSITAYGLVLGTPSFMAPEQAAGKTAEIDGRADLFSLGATGFRLRTGRRIHEGDDAIALVKKMATLPAPPLRDVAPDASAPVARIIDKALKFKREDRYASAAAMQKDVRRALAELPRERGPAKPPRPPTPPEKGRGDPTINISERDFERPQAYGLDESVRVPKRRMVLPWLLLGAAGVGGILWYLVHPAVFAELLSPSPPSSVASGAATATLDAGLHASFDAAVRPHPMKGAAPGATLHFPKRD